jgi:class 3 adenylate cyclase
MLGMASDSVQTFTILFVDVAGSVALYESLGDLAAKERIIQLQERIGTIAAECGGTVHEVIGDELMLRFDAACDGARGALAIQHVVAAFASQTGTRLEVRIGLHCGETITEGDRMFGDTINVASRVAAIAQGGQIITTQAVVDELPESLRELVRRFDSAPVKGKREPLLIYDLPWQPQDLTVIAPLVSAEHATQTLTLSLSGPRCTLTADQSEFAIGRDPASDLVVNWPSVSRHHATIAYARGRFVLSDSSTNGTYVTLHDNRVVFLRRESLPLWGSGRIALGAPADEGVDHTIDYRCG